MFDNHFSLQNPKICNICNMGCNNLTIKSKISGTLESDSLFGQTYW
jgi:hypothetical protein